MFIDNFFSLHKLPRSLKNVERTFEAKQCGFLPYKIELFFGYFYHTVNFLFCRYTWIKDGKPFNWRHYDDRITQQPGRGTLVLKSPRDEDVGKHTFSFSRKNFVKLISREKL